MQVYCSKCLCNSNMEQLTNTHASILFKMLLQFKHGTVDIPSCKYTDQYVFCSSNMEQLSSPHASSNMELLTYPHASTVYGSKCLCNSNMEQLTITLMQVYCSKCLLQFSHGLVDIIIPSWNYMVQNVFCSSNNWNSN